jgi:uncharacterized membrane protein
LAVHISGAIIGLGPTFAFSIMGPMAGKVGPPGNIVLLEAIEKIERGIVIPVLIVIQLGTGILLIFNRGFNVNFFSHRNGWLIAGIGAYLIAMLLSMVIDVPAMARVISMAKAGDVENPVFASSLNIVQKLGPVLTLLGVFVILMMVWRPGSACVTPNIC